MIDFAHFRENCPTGIIPEWMQKVTRHNGIIQHWIIKKFFLRKISHFFHFFRRNYFFWEKFHNFFSFFSQKFFFWFNFWIAQLAVGAFAFIFLRVGNGYLEQEELDRFLNDFLNSSLVSMEVSYFVAKCFSLLRLEKSDEKTDLMIHFLYTNEFWLTRVDSRVQINRLYN